MSGSSTQPPDPTGLGDMNDIIFVSLGMIVMDEIRFPDGKVLSHVPGGSGLYSTLGARLAVTDVTNSGRVGCLALAGSDFPVSVVDTLKSWGITLCLQQADDRLSTRGLLQYQGTNFKDRVFSYTTAPLQPTPADLTNRIPLLRSVAFHLLASPQDFELSAQQLQAIRHADGVLTKPLLAWEPAPASCRSSFRDEHLKAAKLAHIYSPNHTELLAVFHDVEEPSLVFDRDTIQDIALQLLESGVGPDGQGAVVVRCEEHGSFAVSKAYTGRWFPAFYSGNSSKVVDATGAGNAFLGGATAKLAEGAGLTEAVIMGTVAASFAIEQIGLPERAGEGKGETWNGVGVLSRIEAYRAKMEKNY
ncbi:Ribokinase-like protein [Cercophora samala]|uniref:Ribokinase-like protein n=1 Tax=Cercophora samala TaxID=330535 RepID=A0AA40D9M0_9PEZI|nr:Ribokinase-like protein [Cercophora samala]